MEIKITNRKVLKIKILLIDLAGYQ